MITSPKRLPTQKKARGQLLEWMSICHERALHRALQELKAQFDAWEAGKISAFDLENKVHLFHEGPSKNLYNQYQVRSDMRLLFLAAAIRDGLVDITELREDIRQDAEKCLTTLKHIFRTPFSKTQE